MRTFWACAAAFAFLATGCDKENLVCVPDGATNVNESGETANCYILEPETTSVFSAAYKGNSKTEAIADATEAKLVWQDTKSLVTELYYVPDTKQVVVSTGKTPGNAVVAVVNAEGAILWSWHLWVCNYNPAASLWSTPAASNGSVWKFMDRNLGAVNAKPEEPRTHGLLYQWGRKDPFTSAVVNTQQNEDYSYLEDGEPKVFDINNNVISKTPYELAEGHGTFDKSVLNPNVFYKILQITDEEGEQSNDYKTKDWKDVSDDDSWGGVSFRKTINDPCPPGYKVPVCDADENTPYDWHDYDAMTWDDENHGAIQDGQWWPAAGTRVNYSGGLDFPATNYYGGMWIGTAGKASSDLVTYPALYGQYQFIINGKRTYTRIQKDSRAQGLSVRCVAE